MARIARIVVPNCPHLICQRGNRGGRVFFSRGDRERYLEILSGYLAVGAIKLWAYGLAASEVRMVVVPPGAKALGDALRNAHTRHSQLVNRRQKTTGHLFHGRFYSCPLDEDYLATAVRWVERFTGKLPPASTSSAAAHCRGRAPCLPTEGGHGAPPLAGDLPLLTTVGNWRKWLAQPDEPAVLDRLLSRLRVGKPAGSPEFTRRVEILTGLNLSRPPGRPSGKAPE